MALVMVSPNMPSGLRLPALFSSVLNEAVTFDVNGDSNTARFQVLIYEAPVEVFYEGPAIFKNQGEVSYLRLGSSNSPWLTYGDLNGEVLFSYANLLVF